MYHVKLFNMVFLAIAYLTMSMGELTNNNFQQAYFQRVGQGGAMKAHRGLSQYHVESMLECGQLCLQKTACDLVNYKSDYIAKEINCQLSSLSAISTAPDQVARRSWTLYEIITVEKPMMLVDKRVEEEEEEEEGRRKEEKEEEEEEEEESNESVCQNGSTYINDDSKLSGFRCECPLDYYGEYCEILM